MWTGAGEISAGYEGNLRPPLVDDTRALWLSLSAVSPLCLSSPQDGLRTAFLRAVTGFMQATGTSIGGKIPPRIRPSGPRRAAQSPRSAPTLFPGTSRGPTLVFPPNPPKSDPDDTKLDPIGGRYETGYHSRGGASFRSQLQFPPVFPPSSHFFPLPVASEALSRDYRAPFLALIYFRLISLISLPWSGTRTHCFWPKRTNFPLSLIFLFIPRKRIGLVESVPQHSFLLLGPLQVPFYPLSSSPRPAPRAWRTMTAAASARPR